MHEMKVSRLCDSLEYLFNPLDIDKMVRWNRFLTFFDSQYCGIKKNLEYVRMLEYLKFYIQIYLKFVYSNFHFLDVSNLYVTRSNSSFDAIYK